MEERKWEEWTAPPPDKAIDISANSEDEDDAEEIRKMVEEIIAEHEADATMKLSKGQIDSLTREAMAGWRRPQAVVPCIRDKNGKKVGRNSICPLCDSGKKLKHCCWEAFNA